VVVRTGVEEVNVGRGGRGVFIRGRERAVEIGGEEKDGMRQDKTRQGRGGRRSGGSSGLELVLLRFPWGRQGDRGTADPNLSVR
jgi:hypothetical protein